MTPFCARRRRPSGLGGDRDVRRDRLVDDDSRAAVERQTELDGRARVPVLAAGVNGSWVMSTPPKLSVSAPSGRLNEGAGGLVVVIALAGVVLPR